MEYQHPELELKKYWSIVMRGKQIVFLVSAGVIVLAALYNFLSRPVYESTARILIDNKGNQSSINFLDIRTGDVSIKVANEVENLRSYSMAEAVAKSLLKIGDARPDRTKETLLFSMSEDERQDTIVSLARVTENVLESVDFAPMKDSDIIKIVGRSSDPEEAALLANTYAQVFVDHNFGASRAKSKTVREFLQAELAAGQSNLDSAELSLQNYMRSSGVVSLEGESKRVTEQLSDLEARHDALEVEITTRAKTLESYKKELAEQEPNFAESIEQSNDAYVRILQEQLATLEVQRDVVIAQNPDQVGKKVYSQKLKDIDGQIAALRKNLRDRTKDFIAALQPGEAEASGRGSGAGFLAQLKQKIIEQQIELQGLTERRKALGKVIAGYNAQFNQIPKKSAGFARRQRAALSSEKLFLMLQEKFNEVLVTEKSEFGYVQLIDRGVVPLKPVSPIVWLNMLLALILGMGMGIAAVILRAEMDVRAREPDDLRKFGHSLLSTIGVICPDGENGSIEAMGLDAKKLDKHLIAFHNPLSPLTESYRYLLTSIQSIERENVVRSLVVTSANPGEGKSTTVANLAIIFAEAEKKVLLVDADLRRPAIHSLFGLKPAPGLTDMLLGKSFFEDLVQRNVLPHLDVICSGEVAANSAGLLGSAAMRGFEEFFLKSYDVVLFDSPPLHAVTDAAVISKRVDGAVLVVSAGTTKLPSLKRAVESFGSVGGKVLGIVLNKYDVRKTYRGEYGSEGYGYYSYGYSRSPNGKSKTKRYV